MTTSTTWADQPPCPSMRYEDRGPAYRFAGLCHACGRSTIHRDADGRARHQPMPAGLLA